MDELVEERYRKLKEIQNAGINPYPYAFKQSHHALELLTKYQTLKKETRTKTTVRVAGRIMLLRRMGKASFAHLQDQSGKIQIYVKQDLVGSPVYQLWKQLDLGDLLGVTGTIFTTKTGEVTIEVKNLEVLAKALRPLPEKYHGLKDIEQRYRKRHLDLIVNPEVREYFILRSKIIKAFREFLDKKGFLEVETPTLQPLYGGASAKPFITHHNTLKQDLYLRISDELYLKRLIIGGFEKVYEICKDFRNEGVDTSHNPEFTMLEWYETYQDYEHGMHMFESIVEYAAKKALETTKVTFAGHSIDVKTPWKRMKMTDAIKKFANIDVLTLNEQGLRTALDERKISYDPKSSWGLLVQKLFEETCEEHLIQPTIIYDHPYETTPLCKPLRNGDSRFIERFEPYIAGLEMGNSYSELNDPILQRTYMEASQKRLKGGDDEASPLDEDFLEALEQGMPPMSGVGIGVDRIVMILTGKESIRDVVFFPAMRVEETENTKT